MKPKLRRHLSGEFVLRQVRGGAWRLSRAELPSIDIWLRGTDAAEAGTAGFAGLIDGAAVSDVDIDWQSDRVILRLTSATLPPLKFGSVIVHEPRVGLYDALALPPFDRAARRFWRNVFRLVRVPGGRLLLNLLARRSS